jgi:putative Ig domain-containing protein
MCVDTLRPFCYSICFAYCVDGSIRGSFKPQPGQIQEKSKGDMTTSNEFAQFGKIPVDCDWRAGRPARTGINPTLLSATIFLLVFVIILPGCGGGSSNTGIVLEVQPNIAQTMDEGEQQVFTAFLSPDPANKGVTWSLSGTGCAGDGCGKLSATTGSPITYTAPSGLAASLIVTLKCVANESISVTQSVTITVVLPPTFATTPLPPNGSNGVPYNFQIVVTGGVPPLTFSLKSGNLPAGLTLNPTGSIVGKPTGPGPGPNPSLFTVQVADNVASPTPIVSPQFSVSISPAPTLSITSTGALTPGTLNAVYSSTRINTTGGVPPFRWTISSGALPPGLELDPVSGVISGTPTQADTFFFTTTVRDSTLPNNQIVSTPSSLSITISAAAPLTITTSSLPSGQTLTPYSAAVAVSGGVAPYTWSVMTGQLPSGLKLNPSTGQITGTPILVTTSKFTIQVIDSETSPPQVQTATFIIVITAGTANPNGLLKGSYAFLFKGFDTQGPVMIAGVFLANGAGSITSGTEAMNRISGVTLAATLAGTYAIGSDGRGTMTLTATDSHLVTLTSAYQLVFDSDGNARFFENDSANTTPPHIPTRGEGVIKLQSGTNFTAGNFSGNYAFAFSGRDLNGTPSALAGFVHADGNQTLSPGVVDFNDAGMFNPQNQLSGDFAVTTAAGRGTSALDFAVIGNPQVSLRYSFYFVSPTDLFFVSSDVTDSTHPLLAGEMILQDPSVKFDQTALNGPSIATGTGLDTNASAFVGRLLTADPACTGASTISFVFNQNDGGVVSAPNPVCGTYSVDPDGRVTFTNLGSRVAAAFLTGRNQAFLIGNDAGATVGQIEPQTGTPFTLSSVQGGYTLSATAPDEKNVKNLLGQLVCLLGNGSMTGTVDEIDPDGTPNSTPSATLIFTLTDTTRSRGTVTTNTALVPANLAFYIVSPSKIRLISTDTGDQHPQVISLDH